MKSDSLIGVVDLMNGRAVRAAGGQRQAYQPVHGFRLDHGREIRISGDPTKLVDCYRHSNLRSIYIADLDGLLGHTRQSGSIANLLGHHVWADPPLVDFGISGTEQDQELADLVSICQNHDARLVIATESAISTDLVDRLQKLSPSVRLVVSFDYRDGVWLGQPTTESQWLAACDHSRLDAVILLDIGSVGSRSTERAETLCRRLGPRLAPHPVITGGGIRHAEDASRLINAGAERLLVASMFISMD